MQHIKVITEPVDKNGKIVLTKAEFEKYLNDAYSDGYADGSLLTVSYGNDTISTSYLTTANSVGISTSSINTIAK